MVVITKMHSKTLFTMTQLYLPFVQNVACDLFYDFQTATPAGRMNCYLSREIKVEPVDVGHDDDDDDETHVC